MLDEGWGWWVVPTWVDEKYEKFSKIAQSALNVSNHVGSVVGELEIAATLADCLNDPAIKHERNWKELCLENVRSLGASCAAYADV